MDHIENHETERPTIVLPRWAVFLVAVVMLFLGIIFWQAGDNPKQDIGTAQKLIGIVVKKADSTRTRAIIDTQEGNHEEAGRGYTFAAELYKTASEMLAALIAAATNDMTKKQLNADKGQQDSAAGNALIDAANSFLKTGDTKKAKAAFGKAKKCFEAAKKAYSEAGDQTKVGMMDQAIKQAQNKFESIK